MRKKEYLIKQFSKTNKKNLENYVISRIWNLLDRQDIKIITQQHVRLSDGRRALTDLFFPQIGLHVEVDEEQHYLIDENHKITGVKEKFLRTEDEQREEDIVNATGHTLKRVDVTKKKTLHDIHCNIDQIVETVKELVGLKDAEKKFKSWNVDDEQNPQIYIDKGSISIEDDVAFETQALACNCFGRDYSREHRLNGWQVHPRCEDIRIWFPVLYKNDKWENDLSADEETITEFPNPEIKNNEKHMLRTKINKHFHRRIVFARVKGPLGDVLYRFKGLFEYSEEDSNKKKRNVFNRVGSSVITYGPQISKKCLD